MPIERAVVNASPLIYLARAGLLDLLRHAAQIIVVPAIVSDEILARGTSDPCAAALLQTPWLASVESPPATPELLAWDLGPGETAVLSYALANPASLVVIDDLAGRRCAEAMGVPLRGTLGLVLRARRSGAIPQAREVVERLRASGMYLSDRVMNQALREVGE